MARGKIRELLFSILLLCAAAGCSLRATSSPNTPAAVVELATPAGQETQINATQPAHTTSPTTGVLPDQITPGLNPTTAMTSAEERIEWLRTNTVIVRSIDPADEAYPDLEPLKDIIGDSQVVLLGEAAHGDGSTFLAKTRLVKFLHQEMGFSVLAIESGFYDCLQAWEQIEGGSEPYPSLKQALFSIWTDSQQFWPLVEYIDEVKHSSNPLEVSGFDCQFTGEASRDNLVPDLEGFLKEWEIPLPDEETWNVSS